MNNLMGREVEKSLPHPERSQYIILKIQIQLCHFNIIVMSHVPQNIGFVVAKKIVQDCVSFHIFKITPVFHNFK